MRRALPIVIAAALALAPAMASAEVQWRLLKQHGQPYLQGMPDESESDNEFWALCRAGGAIEVGIGADSNVGKGEGEPVSVTLTSAGARATVNGRSRKSMNFEMTAGTELQTQVSRDDALFKVLAAGQPITVAGSIKTATWPAKGLKAKVAAFLAACK
ncbi:MAG TPA: hypothetical protein VFB31_02135 [Pseudolabrys sp.]|nr:hypothetical protein [Pseudolabrys sp.]